MAGDERDRETDSAVVRPTQSEDVTEPAGRLVEPVLADPGREVVPVVGVAEVGEPDAVLDVDRVGVRPGDQGPGTAQDQSGVRVKQSVTPEMLLTPTVSCHKDRGSFKQRKFHTRVILILPLEIDSFRVCASYYHARTTH